MNIRFRQSQIWNDWIHYTVAHSQEEKDNHDRNRIKMGRTKWGDLGRGCFDFPFPKLSFYQVLFCQMSVEHKHNFWIGFDELFTHIWLHNIHNIWHEAWCISCTMHSCQSIWLGRSPSVDGNAIYILSIHIFLQPVNPVFFKSFGQKNEISKHCCWNPVGSFPRRRLAPLLGPN